MSVEVPLSFAVVSNGEVAAPLMSKKFNSGFCAPGVAAQLNVTEYTVPGVALGAHHHCEKNELVGSSDAVECDQVKAGLLVTLVGVFVPLFCVRPIASRFPVENI